MLLVVQNASTSSRWLCAQLDKFSQRSPVLRDQSRGSFEVMFQSLSKLDIGFLRSLQSFTCFHGELSPSAFSADCVSNDVGGGGAGQVTLDRGGVGGEPNPSKWRVAFLRLFGTNASQQKLHLSRDIQGSLRRAARISHRATKIRASGTHRSKKSLSAAFYVRGGAEGKHPSCPLERGA